MDPEIILRRGEGGGGQKGGVKNTHALGVAN